MTKPIIVLVRPQMHENIGAVARAMANFALEDLYIVAPRDGKPSQKAYAMSSGADFILDKAIIFDSVADALSDVNYVFATTARKRDIYKPAYNPMEAGEISIEKLSGGNKLALLFGAERAGLENSEIDLADALIHIPVNPDFSSLNLAQSVLLIAYEWFRLSGQKTKYSPNEIKFATKKDLDYFYQHLETELEQRGFFYPIEKKESMVQTLRALFSRTQMNEQEVRTMRGVIKSLTKEL